VLIIMLDDAGYSNAGSYGGAIRTPTFDRIGDQGIRYTLLSATDLRCPISRWCERIDEHGIGQSTA